MRTARGRMIGSVAAVAIAGVFAWQQREIVRLRRESAVQARQLQQAASAQAVLNATLEADNRALRQAAVAAAVQRRASASEGMARSQAAPGEGGRRAMNELRALLAERAQTVADAREAARTWHIRDGSREMALAIAQATADIDEQITTLAGPATARALGVRAEAMSLSPGPGLALGGSTSPGQGIPLSQGTSLSQGMPLGQGAPLGDGTINETSLNSLPTPPPEPSAAGAASSPPAPQPATYVTVISAPSTTIVNPPADATTSPAPAYTLPYLVPLGGFGVTYGTPRRARALSPSQKFLAQAKAFGASAGIPLKGTPLGRMVTNNPLHRAP